MFGPLWGWRWPDVVVVFCCCWYDDADNDNIHFRGETTIQRSSMVALRSSCGAWSFCINVVQYWMYIIRVIYILLYTCMYIYIDIYTQFIILAKDIFYGREVAFGEWVNLHTSKAKVAKGNFHSNIHIIIFPEGYCDLYHFWKSQYPSHFVGYIIHHCCFLCGLTIDPSTWDLHTWPPKCFSIAATIFFWSSQKNVLVKPHTLW